MISGMLPWDTARCRGPVRAGRADRTALRLSGGDVLVDGLAPELSLYGLLDAGGGALPVGTCANRSQGLGAQEDAGDSLMLRGGYRRPAASLLRRSPMTETPGRGSFS